LRKISTSENTDPHKQREYFRREKLARRFADKSMYFFSWTSQHKKKTRGEACPPFTGLLSRTSKKKKKKNYETLGSSEITTGRS
jgi:hypothetical protein